MEKSRENYTRVTKILSPFTGFSKIKPEVLAKAAARGTKVHKICEGIMLGLGEHDVDDETRPYVESFKLWWNLGHEVVAIEKRFYCDQLHITGQIDIIIRLPNGSLSIVDLKTSSTPSKTWKAQGQAYCYLATQSGYLITEIIFLRLKKSGKAPQLIDYPAETSFFFAVYIVFNHFYQEKNE